MSKCRFTNDYTVYSSKTTLPIAFGTLDECSRALGVTKASFASMASRRNNPKRRSPKYIIVKEGVDEEVKVV